MFCWILLLIIICIVQSIYIGWMHNSRKKKRNIEQTINFFRDLWGKFTCYVLATSIIGLFLGSIYFKQVIGLNEINSWVGIVLGLVALIIGIISLFLSFYNVDQSNATQEKTVEIIADFKMDMINRMNTLQKEVERKIDESSEKTRKEINGRKYTENNNTSVKQETGNDVKWEDS